MTKRTEMNRPTSKWNRAATVLAAFTLSAPIAAVAAAAPAAARGCKIVQVGEFHVASARNRPLVSGEINGQTAPILIDTGSGASFVWEGAARRLGLTLTSTRGVKFYGVGGEATVQVTTVPLLRIGQYAVKNVDFTVVGHGRMERPGDPVVVLGEDFLSQFATEFDLANGMIRLLRPQGCKPEQMAYWSHVYSQAELARNDYGHAQIRSVVMINGKPADALLDTGAPVSIITPWAATHAGAKDFRAGESGAAERRTVSGIGAATTESWVTQLDSFSVGDETIKNVRLRVADMFGRDQAVETGSHISQPVGNMPDMLLGFDFFMSHRVLVMSKERLMVFTYNGGPVFQSDKPRKPAAAEASVPAKAPEASAATQAPEAPAATEAPNGA